MGACDIPSGIHGDAGEIPGKGVWWKIYAIVHITR